MLRIGGYNASGGGESSIGFSLNYWVDWAVTFLAMYLCYSCNSHEMMVLRIVYLIISYIFPYYYMIYYVGYHYFLARPCANSFGVVGVLNR